MDPNCGPAGSLINGWLGNRWTGKIGDGTQGLQADQFFLQSFRDAGLAINLRASRSSFVPFSDEAVSLMKFVSISSSSRRCSSPSPRPRSSRFRAQTPATGIRNLTTLTDSVCRPDNHFKLACHNRVSHHPSSDQMNFCPVPARAMPCSQCQMWSCSPSLLNQS